VRTIGLSKAHGAQARKLLLHAAKRNLREDQKGAAPAAIDRRSHLNRRIAGPALLLPMWWRAGAHDGRRRRFATTSRRHERSFPLPAGTSIDTAVYFAQCLQWAIAQFGQHRVGTFLHDGARHVCIWCADGRRSMPGQPADRPGSARQPARFVHQTGAGVQTEKTNAARCTA
jgi:hypothetical protein